MVNWQLQGFTFLSGSFTVDITLGTLAAWNIVVAAAAPGDLASLNGNVPASPGAAGATYDADSILDSVVARVTSLWQMESA